MIEVASLLGLSYTGKSTLAEGVATRLAGEGIVADVVKKDEAMKALGRERYGDNDQSGGYSIKGFFRHGGIPSKDLHTWMNKQVTASRDLGHIVILEGGTRTRDAQAETLQGVELGEDDFRIFMLELPFREVLRRARQRREQTGQYADMLPVAAAKLYAQYKVMRSDNAPQPTDPDVMVLDAGLAPAELVEITVNEILEPTKQ
jgi:hypothetical protein